MRPPRVRRPLLQRARLHGVPIVAIVLDLDAGARPCPATRSRARIVDPDVVDRHLVAIRETVDGGGLPSEGVDQVVVLRDPIDVAALALERRMTRR